MTEVKKDAQKTPPAPEQQQPKPRQIIIETDGNSINLVKNETAGVLELAAVLQTILAKLMQK